MKYTRNLVLFTIINLISSILFFTFLHEGILVQKTGSNPDTFVTYLPTLYAAVWFFSGLIFAGLDKARKVRYDLSIAYHLAATAVITVAMLYAFALFETFRTWQFIVFPALAMAVSLAVHWIFVKDKTKGIDKKEAFK